MKSGDFHNAQLEKLEALWADAGSWLALFQAVRYCGEAEIPLPEWAAIAVLNIIQDRFHDRSEAGTDGAHGSLWGRLRMDYAHYARWNAVRWAMAFNSVTELPDNRGRPKKDTVTKKAILHEALTRLNDARSSRAKGSLQQIEESYRLVEASRQGGEKRFAFEELYFPPE
jgi:hypothetical protein